MRFCHTKSIGTSRTLILSINRIVRFRGAPIVFIRVQAHSNQFRFIRTFGQNLSKSSDCVSYSGLVLLCLNNGSDNSIKHRSRQQLEMHVQQQLNIRFTRTLDKYMYFVTEVAWLVCTPRVVKSMKRLLAAGKLSSPMLFSCTSNFIIIAFCSIRVYLYCRDESTTVETCTTTI